MKRLVPIVLLIIAATAAAVSPASARKDKFARKLNTFNSIVKELQANYVDTVDADKVMDAAIEALLYQFDPYTEYYPADDQDELLSLSQGQYAGIGSVIQKRGATVIISAPSEGSPAKRAGLRPGDVIVAIDGDTLKPDVDVSAVSRRLRGQAGTKLHLDIRRPYVADSMLAIDIVRDNIKVNPLPYAGVDADGMGYIRLTTFNESAGRRVREAAAELLKNPDLKGIIIDLRTNGGGLLEGAVQVAANFVPRGTEIVRTKGRNPRDEKIYKTTASPLDTKIPLAVLIDGQTASSSEIVAGAMQDLDRAVIVGERSYGKGLVQTPRPLPYKDLLKVTVGKYYIPSGRLIQALDYSHRDEDGRPARTPDSLTHEFHTKAGRIVRDGGGITPDISVELPETNRLLYNIMADNWAFDFANRYAARHAQLPATDSIVTDSLFEEFVATIDPTKFKYDKPCEVAIDYLRKAAKIEGYMTDSVAAQFDVLASMLHHDLTHDLHLNKKQIIDILDTEIAQRYLSDAEQVRRHLPADPVYKAAKEELLKKSKK